MQSVRGELSIDGDEPFAVDFDLDENGRGYIAATRERMVKAHLGRSIKLTDEDRRTLQLIVDSVGWRGGEFHVRGAAE
jgi:hypothetical protein